MPRRSPAPLEPDRVERQLSVGAVGQQDARDMATASLALERRSTARDRRPQVIAASGSPRFGEREEESRRPGQPSVRGESRAGRERERSRRA